MNDTILFAQQPIYDMNNNVYGFELLYRGDLVNSAIVDNAAATTEVLINYCTGIIEPNSHQCKRIFLNVDEEFICSDIPKSLPPENMVLEILETVKPTPNVIKSLTKLRKQGFTLALDDFEFESGKEAFFPLLSIVKIDVSQMSFNYIQQQLKIFSFARKILLAEKVEDKTICNACKEIGFDLFQGYYLERPILIEGKKISANKQALLNLITNMCREDISVLEVSELLLTDPNLVVKILKIVNCPLYPFNREINNIKEAVVKLGIDVVKQWAVVLSLVANSDQPSELFRTLLIRAKTCELYAKLLKKDACQDYFVIGLFSGLDAVLGLEMGRLIETVNLPDKIKKELLPDVRDASGVLATVLLFENRAPSNGRTLSRENAHQLNDAYWTSTMWAGELMDFIG